MNYEELICSKIDHTNLSPVLSSENLIRLCKEAIQYNFASVVVNPYYVNLANEFLNKVKSNTKICTVIGFPLGQNTSEIKRLEARQAILDGANELDMVINIAALKDGDFNVIENEINDLVSLSENITTKVIIETGLLSDEEKRDVCIIAKKSGVDYIKTSTGVNSRGATVEDIEFIKNIVPSMKIKASGGIKNLETAKEMISAGADRIGTSRAMSIIKEL